MMNQMLWKMWTQLKSCRSHRYLLLKMTLALLMVLVMLRLPNVWVSPSGTFKTSRLFQQYYKTEYLDSIRSNDSTPKHIQDSENAENAKNSENAENAKNAKNAENAESAKTNEIPGSTEGTKTAPPPKRILFWTPFWGSHKSWSKPFVDLLGGQCPASDCVLLHDRSELSSADAVVFHLTKGDLKPSQLPTQRRPAGQIWVLFSVESPALAQVRASNLTALNGLFNWTMTYRWDSDLPMPYGLVLPRVAMSDAVSLTSLPEAVRQALPRRPSFERSRRPALKKRLVSWMVSNCNTPGGREDYVRQLEKHVQVDIYGKCGKHKCGHRDTLGAQDAKGSNDACEDVIASSKFYLAFENALCPQYTTEKFFRTLTLGTVPVVFGGADYSQLAPEGSYIDARRYSPAQLGRLLHQLDANDTAYGELFRWQDRFRVLNAFPRRPLTCGLCQRLQRLPPGALVGSHTALETWYGAEQCSRWTPTPG